MYDEWSEILVCPTCQGSLDRTSGGWWCGRCAAEYPVVGRVPCMVNWAALPEQVRQEMAGQDRHFAPLAQKAVYKPRFHPLYQRTRLQRRLAELLAAMGAGLPTAASVHVACCGSGYEVEALVRAGYQVSASDLSGQALRAFYKRAANRGYHVPCLQADVGGLPFPDAAFDVAVTVEGLHHTPDPEAALRELVRIARRRVAVIEPYTGALFDWLARLGLAHRREHSGIRPTPLSAQTLAQVMATTSVSEPYRRLYLDLPPRCLPGRLGDWPPSAYLLLTVTRLAQLLLRPLGIGNRVMWIADIASGP